MKKTITTLFVILSALCGCELYSTAAGIHGSNSMHWPKRPTHPGPCDGEPIGDLEN